MPQERSVHIAYESITDDSHTASPHMRQKITGIIEKEFPHCRVIHLAAESEESLRHCNRLHPDVVIISATLPKKDPCSFHDVIRALKQMSGVSIIVVYKTDTITIDRSESLFNGILFILVENLKEELTTLLAS